MKRTYENDRIKVFWDSDKCYHAGFCVRDLPEVFNVQRRPWVDVSAADVGKIRRVIDSCPSAALSYEVLGEDLKAVTIRVLKDGPFLVRGSCQLLKADGEVIETDGTFVLCRCGSSKEMPFCDGEHIRLGFKDI